MMQENTRGFTKGIDLRGTANVTTTQYKHSTSLSFDLTDPLDCLIIHFFFIRCIATYDYMCNCKK